MNYIDLLKEEYRKELDQKYFNVKIFDRYNEFGNGSVLLFSKYNLTNNYGWDIPNDSSKIFSKSDIRDIKLREINDI